MVYGYSGGNEGARQIITILEKNGINGIPQEVTILGVVFQLMNGSTILRTAASKSTRVTTSFMPLGKVLSLSGSKHSVGCSISLELSSPAARPRRAHRSMSPRRSPRLSR